LFKKNNELIETESTYYLHYKEIIGDDSNASSPAAADCIKITRLTALSTLRG
jgi:hypothetical protein